MSPTFKRDPSPLNHTEAALLSRGVDKKTAAKFRKNGWTISKLKRQSDSQLENLGLPVTVIKRIRAGGRPNIPFENLVKVLISSRFTCCICHDPKKSIIVHHIKQWSKSKDHSPSNLAVLCLDHHDKAHSTSTLSRNLGNREIDSAKEQWEIEVRKTNTEAILEASRVNADAWWYFNHLRLFELATDLKLKFKRLQYYRAALNGGLIRPDGLLKPRSENLDYMYSGGEGMLLYEYVREVMNTVLEHLTVFNMSDYLDRSLLKPVLKTGDFIFVQGAHTFGALGRHHSNGRGQTQRGIRKANHVKVSFTFDRWEATSCSAWGSWLLGRQDAASIIRVVKVHSADGVLSIEGTVFGIAQALEGLKEREYSPPPYQRGYDVYDEDDEDEDLWDD